MSGLKVLNANPYSSDIDVPCVEYSDEERGGSNSQSHSIRLPITNASMGTVASATGNDKLLRRSSTHRRRNKTLATPSGSMLLDVPGKFNSVSPKPMKMAAMSSPAASIVKPAFMQASPAMQPATIIQPQPIVQQQPVENTFSQQSQLSKLWNSLGALQSKALTYLTGDASQIPAGTPAPQSYVPQNENANIPVSQSGQTGFSSPLQQTPIINPASQPQNNQFLQPPGGFVQQMPMPYPQTQTNYFSPGNGPQMLPTGPYYNFQPPQMQPPTTSFYSPNLNPMFTTFSQDSPYKKMVKNYKQKDKSGRLPAGADLSDSDDDYDIGQKASTMTDNTSVLTNYFFVGIFGVIAIVLLVITSSGGSSVATTVASTGRTVTNVADGVIEHSVPQSSPAINPISSLFQQLVWILRTTIILAIAGLALYYYLTGNFPEGPKESPSKSSQPTNVKERPGPLLPLLNWWDIVQQRTYPPTRWGGFGSVPPSYSGIGPMLGANGQQIFPPGYSSYPLSAMNNNIMSNPMSVYYQDDDDDEEDSDDEEGSETSYQEYLPAGMFDSRYEPNYFLNKEAKAKAKAKAQAELATKMMPKEPGPVKAEDNKVVFSKSDLPEEFKPHYEPMPPVPGIDDPDPPVSDTLVKNGPDKEKLEEVTKSKKQKSSEGETKSILKKDSDKERIKGVKQDKADYFMDEYSCKPYGPPPKRYTGVIIDKPAQDKAVKT